MAGVAQTHQALIPPAAVHLLAVVATSASVLAQSRSRAQPLPVRHTVLLVPVPKVAQTCLPVDTSLVVAAYLVQVDVLDLVVVLAVVVVVASKLLDAQLFD